MKHVYFVRHGETADNRRWVHQSIDVHLSGKGQAEAEAVGRTFAGMPIDTLLTSDTERAKETAAPIAEATGRTPQSEKVLRELHRGVLVEGRHHLSWNSIVGALSMFLRANDRSYHFGDGENVLEFRDRLKRVLEFIEETPGEEIVVVTHRGVINGLRHCLTHGFTDSPYLFALAAVLAGTKNGSTTELTYDPSRAQPWQVVRTNDTRHLRSR